MAARSPHDRKVVGLNPAGSYETVFLSESRIDALTRDNDKRAPKGANIKKHFAALR